MSHSQTESGGYTKLIIVGGLLVLVFLLGYYSGSRKFSESESTLPLSNTGGSSSTKSADRSDKPSDGVSPINETNKGTVQKRTNPKPKRKKAMPPMPLENLPPAHLKRVREAEEFISRIPALEQELLSKHPLLEKALLLEEQRLNKDKEQLEERKRDEKQLEDWMAQSSENTNQANILLLDGYLKLLEEPDYTPFVEDGLSGGFLSEDITGRFKWHIQKVTGLDLTDIDLNASDTKDITEFREEFRRFSEEIKAKLGDSNADNYSIPAEVEEAARQRAMNYNQRTIIGYYKDSLISEKLDKEISKHYRALKAIRYAHFFKPPPAEIAPLMELLSALSLIHI